MAIPYSSILPPAVEILDANPATLAAASSPSAAHLKDLAWGLYLSASAAQTAKGPLADAKLGPSATKAIEATIDAYTDAVNAMIAPAPVPPATSPPEGFLTIYVGAVINGRWPPVEIPMPPVIDPNTMTLGNVLNDIKGAVNAAIGAFQATGKDAGMVANGLISLENALNSIVSTINEYYPDLLKATG